MDDEDYGYVLTLDGVPLVVHTTEQGAAEGMAGRSAEDQKKMQVWPVPMVKP